MHLGRRELAGLLVDDLGQDGRGRLGADLAVLDARAAEADLVGREDLLIGAGIGHADAVARVIDRGEVDHADEVGAVRGDAAEGDHVVAVVVVGDPLEALPIHVVFPQLLVGQVHGVERLDVGLHLAVRFVVEQHPVQAAVFVPLGELGELAAHKQHLLARVGHHIAIERPERRELVFIGGGHLVDERPLAVHDLVVRERQDIVFGERIHERKRDLVMHVLAEERVGRHVAQHVVHPAHVPLEVKAQAADRARLCDHGPGGGLLGDHHNVGVLAQDQVVQNAQEVDRLEVLAPAVDVGAPFALAVVVQVEHGGDRVHAQAVDVELLDPEHGRGEQQVAHGYLAIVEHARAPLLVLHLERVGVLIEIGAVELDQALPVLGEVRGHPVHDDADAGLVALVHKIHEVVRRAIARGGGEVAGDLIAPGAVERMLGQGHALDVGVAHLLDIGHQLVGQLPVGIEVPVLMALPRAHVHLVDIDGRGVRQVLAAPVHPAAVVPFVAGKIEGLGGVGRPGLGVESVGVSLVQELAVLRVDRILIRIVLLHAGNKALPYACFIPLHDIRIPTPAVELAHDGDLDGVRRQYRKVVTFLSIAGLRMGAHKLVGAAVPAGLKQGGMIFFGCHPCLQSHAFISL